jgi:hypothetical protein
MRKIYFAMIFAALLLMLFAVSCDFNVFQPLEEIEVPSAPISQRATNSAEIYVVEDEELSYIIENLEYKEGALEKVTHTFEIDGKTVSYNAEDGMLQIGDRVARLASHFIKCNTILFNHGIVEESYLDFSEKKTDITQNDPSASKPVPVTPIENIVKEVYGYNSYKLSNMYLETTEGTLSEEEIPSGATNGKLIVKGDFEAAYTGRPGKSTLSIYITEEEFLNISASSDKGVLYRESMDSMKKSAVDAVMPVFERKREQLKP